MKTPECPPPDSCHDDQAVHAWFSLSYANYLTIPRSVLQAMPGAWQERFVALLEELDASIDWRPKDGCYWVTLKDDKGRYRHDPLSDYRRGRWDVEALRIVPPPAIDPAACAGTVAAGALPIPAVPAGAVTSLLPSLRISGLPPGSVVSLWRDVAEWFAGADESGTARFDAGKIPPGRYTVKWGFPESYAAGVVEVRSHPEPGITVVVDYLFPLDPAADVP